MSVNVDLLYSNFADDEEIREMVMLFVNETSARTALFQRYLTGRNWQELQRTAHQLKGSAGSYGFDDLSRAALELDTAVKSRQPEEQIAAAVQRVIEFCQRITSEPRPRVDFAEQIWYTFENERSDK